MSTNRFSLNGDGTASDPPPDDPERCVVTELSKRYKELAALYEDAEERLRKYRIPLDAPPVRYKSVAAHIDHPDLPGAPKIHSYLGFVRYGSGWRICYCQNHDEFDECNWDWKPVVDCRLDVRLEALQHIDALRERVAKTAEECVPRLDDAITAFRKKLERW